MTRHCCVALRLAFAFNLACTSSTQAPPEPTESAAQAIAEALTFHASFDDGIDADFARGDSRLYSAPTYDEIDQRTAGLAGLEIDIAEEAGRYGHALNFLSKNTKAVFYNAEDNVAFSPDGWSGTISFWLSLDPAIDLEPGYCDPIQVTDTAYNDNAIWVDFTDKNPRSFRLGVFGELDVWNQDNPTPNANPAFMARLVQVGEPTFEKGRWTHIAIVHEGLGGGSGEATLYIDGVEQGTTSDIAEPFNWDFSTAAIRLGVNYVGLFDELSFFDRPLTALEIETLRSLDGGVAALRNQ